MSNNMRKSVQVDAEYVDPANDSMKWLMIMVVALLWNKLYFRYQSSLSGIGISYMTMGSWKATLTTSALVAVALFLYHFVVRKFLIFLPKVGQNTYYLSLK